MTSRFEQLANAAMQEETRTLKVVEYHGDGEFVCTIHHKSMGVVDFQLHELQELDSLEIFELRQTNAAKDGDRTWDLVLTEKGERVFCNLRR